MINLDQIIYDLSLVFIGYWIVMGILWLFLKLVVEAPWAPWNEPEALPSPPPPVEPASPFKYCPNCLCYCHDAKGATLEDWKKWRCKNCQARAAVQEVIHS